MIAVRCLALLALLSAALAGIGWVHSDGRVFVVVARPVVALSVDPVAVRPSRSAALRP